MEENKNNQKEPQTKTKDPNQDPKTLRTVVITAICTLLLVVIILLVVIFGLKNCSNRNGASSNSSSQDNETNLKIDNMFKSLVNKQIELDSFDGTVNNIAVVTYTESYPNNFTLNITAYNDTKVYVYEMDAYTYDGDKNEYENFVSYLLLNNKYQSLDASVNLRVFDKDNTSITTSKTQNRYVMSRTPSDTCYISGFYQENNEYHVYFNKEVTTGNDPFVDTATQVIGVSSPLYGYYQSLN